MRHQPPDFGLLFRPGARCRINHSDDGPDVDAMVEVRDAGRLHLATGRLIACDPLYADLLDPFEAAFSMTVPPGHYPVMVSLARRSQAGDPMAPATVEVAAVKLTVRDEPVARWQPAVRPDHDPAAIWAGGLATFPVGRGLAALLDAAAIAALSGLIQRIRMPREVELWEALVDEVFEQQVVELMVDQAADLNVLLFVCPLGPWAYPVWLGRTAAHEPACFVVDLGLVSEHGSGPTRG